MVVRIEPDFLLEATARIVGEVVGVSLKFDDSGFYEEFPAYSGVAQNVRLALLGPPARKYMVGEPWQHYELRASTRCTGRQDGPRITHIQRRIVSDGRLRSALI
jgi:hypothetical protein